MKNVGEKDKLIRTILAIVLLVVGHTTKIYLLNALALILLLTSIFGVCGIYKLIGVNTCKNKNQKDSDKK